MRWQQKIYNQNGNKVRNRDLLNVNTSSDICIFTSPTFDISGATKVIEDSDVCEFSGVSFTDILTAATADCVISASCVDTVDWSTAIIEDGETVYTGNFATTVTSGTPLTTELMSELNIGLNVLGYTYDIIDTELTIEKPFGVTDVQIDVCLDIDAVMSGACSGFTGTCAQYCESACTQTYDTLTSASTGVYIIDNTEPQEEITFTIDFTGRTESFDSTTDFKFEVYKFDHSTRVFTNPAVYQSEEISYSAISATSAVTMSIPVNELEVDGDYLFKGYYDHTVCTDILGRLGLTNDTSVGKYGSEFGLYEASLDWYFLAIQEAEIPIFSSTLSDSARPLGSLVAFSILPSDGQTEFLIQTNIQGDLLVYLNGLMLAERLDYTYIDDIVTLSGESVSGDVLTYVSVANSDAEGLVVDNIDVLSGVTSGVTSGHTGFSYYYNTDTDKYEIFTEFTPQDGNDIVVTLNGATLAPNIDYYQSITNPKRIILEGDIIVGDIFNIIYNAYASFVGEIFSNTPSIYWNIPAPELANGIFTVEVGTDTSFTTLIDSVDVNYVANQSGYATQVTVTGDLGTEYFYRVINEKNYVSLNGDLITTTAISEAISFVVFSNAINSY